MLATSFGIWESHRSEFHNFIFISLHMVLKHVDKNDTTLQKKFFIHCVVQNVPPPVFELENGTTNSKLREPEFHITTLLLGRKKTNNHQHYPNFRHFIFSFHRGKGANVGYQCRLEKSVNDTCDTILKSVPTFNNVVIAGTATRARPAPHNQSKSIFRPCE